MLEKVLELQRESGDIEAAADTPNAIIELVQDPKERARRRREAANLIVSRGGGEEALGLLEAAFSDNPEDDAILASICDVLVSQGKHKQAGKRLSDVLPGLPPPAEIAAARQLRAGLWQRLGEARRKKIPAGAIAAFQNVPRRSTRRTWRRAPSWRACTPRGPSSPNDALENLRRPRRREPAEAREPEGAGAGVRRARVSSIAPAASTSCATCAIRRTRRRARSWRRTRPSS